MFLFIKLNEVVLTFELVDEILKYDHSNDSYIEQCYSANLVSSTKLISFIGRREDIQNLSFRALIVRRGDLLERQLNLRWPVYLINSVHNKNNKTKFSCFTTPPT